MKASGILIVEDEAISAMSLQRKLQKLGYVVLGVATSADSAVQQAHEKHPELVLMDIALKGGQDGIDAALRMQDLDIAIVYLSALSDGGTIDRAKETDPFGYLMKPFEESSLHITIEIALYKHRMERRLRAEITALMRAEKEELKRSNKELEQFAAIASHDLREPLRTMFIYLSLLKEESQHQLNSKSQEYLDFALKAVPRMTGLIEDLLEYSHVGKRKSHTWVDCNEVYRLVVTHLLAAIQENFAEIICDPLPSVFADEMELSQVFQNLISNAIKYRGERNPKIHVRSDRVKDEWRFSIGDNGIGIAPEEQDRIFTVFRRLHSRSKYEGSGLGLAICKKIVGAHGGKIWVESKEGEGSTFYFTLGRRDKEVRQPRELSPSTKEARQPRELVNI